MSASLRSSRNLAQKSRGVLRPFAVAVTCTCAMAGAGIFAETAQAQTTDNYFAGRTIKLIVTQATGGFYDIGARLIAQHWGRYIPGKPNVVVQSQTGSAGVGLANRFAAGADNDGTTLG